MASIALTMLGAVSTTPAQRRDYLTDAEIELVRDAQQIDLRITVLTKAIDRRFFVLVIDSARTKEFEKEGEKWGELPKGSKVELLRDISSILRKAVDDIDDVAERNSDSKFFPKAVAKLDTACKDYKIRSRKFIDTAADERERGALLGSIDLCDQVNEAALRLPKEPAKPEKKKSTN